MCSFQRRGVPIEANICTTLYFAISFPSLSKLIVGTSSRGDHGTKGQQPPKSYIIPIPQIDIIDQPSCPTSIFRIVEQDQVYLAEKPRKRNIKDASCSGLAQATDPLRIFRRVGSPVYHARYTTIRHTVVISGRY